jgi:hypothetical protein
MNQLYLSDVSPKDYRWDVHQVNASQLWRLYQQHIDFEKYASRIQGCSNGLLFKVVGEELRLSFSHFCRVRFCPVCSWRRSLMWKFKAHNLMPKIVRDFPQHRFLFLTLTLRNCAIGELNQTVRHMHQSFIRMTKRKSWGVVDGWIKALEVTRSKDGTAHPHFHALLMVPGSYFGGRRYVSQSEWADLWRECLRIDYTPIIHIKAIHPYMSPTIILPELLGYCTKASHLLAEREWLYTLTRQMHHVRAVGVGGVMKQYLSQLEYDPDFIHANEEQAITLSECPEIEFVWGAKTKRYYATES